MSRASKAEKKAAKKSAVTINDQYDESSRQLTDEEAHRNVSYELPSFGTQVRQCFKVQMKRYTRQRIMWVCVILLALMPVIYLGLKTAKLLLPNTQVANIYMATLLCFGAAIIPLLSAIACGATLSQELNERTVFLSLPLPMSRSAFYLGKFLAGLLLIEGTISAAYGIAVIISMLETTSMFTSMIFESFILALTFGLFCCAISYAMSTKLKRGSTMLPFIVIFIVLPVIGIVVSGYSGVEFLESLCKYIPTYEMDMAINSLGNTAAISVTGIASAMFFGLSMVTYSDNNMAVAAVSVIISIVLLYAGYIVIKRRDM